MHEPLIGNNTSEGVKLDALTGFKPYVSFEGDFEGMMIEADNTCEDISLIMLDIDQFKKINDNYGHAAGNDVLEAIAEKLRRYGSEDFSYYRYGGDCLAVLMPAIEKEKAFLVIEKTREAISTNPVEIQADNPEWKVLKGDKIHISVSIGVATYREDGGNMIELVRKADGAMYRAKTLGRNKVCLAREEKMVTKTSHYTTEQLQRLTELSKEKSAGEAYLLREALDDLLKKYDDKKILR